MANSTLLVSILACRVEKGARYAHEGISRPTCRRIPLRSSKSGPKAKL